MGRALLGTAIVWAVCGLSNPAARAAESLNLLLANVNSTRANLGGDCCAPAPVPCCPTPCIIYRHLFVHRKVCCGCPTPEPINTVIQAKNPCTGCPVEIPLCIPGCTTGEAKVSCDVGIFGRDVLWYEWCNGFKVKVAFKHCGDVIVTTYGS